VTLQEFMAFMINKETENVRSSEEIEMAFRALSKELRPYVTAEELYAVCQNMGEMTLFKGKQNTKHKAFKLKNQNYFRNKLKKIRNRIYF